MTSKLKCPFCQTELDMDMMGEIGCPNDSCKKSMFMVGTKELWQALIQAKQDLEQSEKCCSAWETQALDYKAETIALSGKLKIATKALKDARMFVYTHCNATAVKTIDKALERIIVLKEKRHENNI